MRLSVLVVKRAMDIVISLCVLTLASPFILFIAILIILDTPGPVLYTQKRVRRCYDENHRRRSCPSNRDTFNIYKFRTMVDNAERMTGAIHAAEDDDRITSVGQWLRRYRLDELPNFFNVLKGDMSVVGPRADRMADRTAVEHEFPFVWERTRFVKPGITGWAQIALRSDGTIINPFHPLLQLVPAIDKGQPVMSFRYKLYYDAAYAMRMMNFLSFLKTDIKILIITPYVMFFRQNTI